MTAASPYAPARRNSYLRRRSSSSIQPSNASGAGGIAGVAMFWFVIRFWKQVTNRELVMKILRERPSILSLCQGMIGWTGESSEGTALPRSLPSDLKSSDEASAQRIQENQQLIHGVLKYWFGQHSPDNSQKNLWMIASSSVQLRQKVDQEITEKFESLLLELSRHANSSSPNTRWSEWCLGSEDTIYGSHGKIAAIIVLDQFSRHIIRHYETIAKTTKSKLPSKKELDVQALKTAQLFVERHKDEIEYGMIPLPMRIFALMPYRHASTIESVEFVQKCIEKCEGMSSQMGSMLVRFRKATNRRVMLLQDAARRTGRSKIEGGGPATDLSTSEGIKDDELLETFPFDADMAPSVSHPIHKTIATFLEDRGIHPSRENKTSQPRSSVIVSLSGGVDSMVIASVLAYLESSCNYNLDVTAVHIDYANRPESAAEADFVRRYSKGLGITFKCRRIDEVTRGVTARDDYERIARELRYSSYKEAIVYAKNALEDTARADNMAIGVMLGHHRGDLRENVLSNAHKGCGPLDLSGMTEVSRNDGVLIYRPLLSLEKSSVFDYALKYGVPYFKDTTPHWSTRGKLRNQLLPLLQEIYGEGSMNNLSNLAVESDACRALLQMSMFGPFLERIQRKPMGISFETNPWKDQALFFWKLVLREALHSAGFGMFSDKSVLSFLERVQAKKLRAGWLQCRRDYAVYLQEDGRVYVLYPSSFPFNKKDMYNVTGQDVRYNEARQVGPWMITAEVVSEKGDGLGTSSLAEKALPSMDYLMEGSIEYHLTAPTWTQEGDHCEPRQLQFCRFTKASRPMAWKNNEQNRNMYLKVQETLPLLGIDGTAQAAKIDFRRSGCAHEVEGVEHVNSTRLIRVAMHLARG